jgi:putative flippase GtrA
MRIAAFVGVGAVGFVVQMTTLAGLLAGGCPDLVATALAALVAVAHNFVWHERWTWADRTAGRSGVTKRLSWFVGATGSTSIAGNVVITAAYVRLLGLSALPANALAIATLAIANFLIADRWIFSGADSLHRDARAFECCAKLGRQLVRAWRISVNADCVGLERHE